MDITKIREIICEELRARYEDAVQDYKCTFDYYYWGMFDAFEIAEQIVKKHFEGGDEK